MSEEVRVRDERGVRWIELNRPASKNGLTMPVSDAILEAVRGVGESPELRVLVLTGAGGSFCSGIDLKEAMKRGSIDPREIEDRLRTSFHGIIRALRDAAVPTIAAVDGPAAGFGCDLALACDLRLVTERARFGEIFVRRGLLPDGGGTYHLPRLVGLGRALELMLTGDMVDADEAYRIGLANRVFPADEFREELELFAGRLAAGPPLVHRAVKEAVYASQEGDLDAALDREAKAQAKLLGSADFAEGVAAFLEKRDPRFRGE